MEEIGLVIQIQSHYCINDLLLFKPVMFDNFN